MEWTLALLTNYLYLPYAFLIPRALSSATNGTAAGPAGSKRRDAMGMTIFVALCAMAEGFLIYVLVQFVREGRRGKMPHRPPPLYPGVPAGAAGAREARRNVIEITVPEGSMAETRTGRRAS